jgi:hypothetical protein
VAAEDTAPHEARGDPPFLGVELVGAYLALVGDVVAHLLLSCRVVFHGFPSW